MARLPERGQDVRHARPRDDERDTRPTGYPRISVRHEPRSLLMAGRDVTDTRLLEAAVQLERVDAGDAEDDLHSAGGEALDDGDPTRAHLSLPSTTGVSGRPVRDQAITFSAW